MGSIAKMLSMITKEQLETGAVFVDSFGFNNYWNEYEYAVESNLIDDAIDNVIEIKNEYIHNECEYIFSGAQL